MSSTNIIRGNPVFMERVIMVWRFKDAPEVLRKLSTSGGHEDWLALVPECMRGEYISWLEGLPFGICDIQRAKLPDGRTVFIGTHA